MSDFSVETTTHQGTRYESASDVAALEGILKRNEPVVRYQVSQDGNTLIHLMIAGRLAQLALWTAVEKVNYLTTGPMLPGETRDLGWEVYPAWMVTEDVPTAVAAALLFAKERTLDPALTWEFQDLG